MKDSDIRFVKQWEANRKLGRMRYAVLQGSGFGLILFLFTGLYSLWEKPFAQVFLSTRSFIVLLFWIACGIIGFASLMWPMNEYFYRNKKKD